VRPQPVAVPALATYRVQRMYLDGRFDLDQLSKASRRPLELTFTNGFTRRTSPLRVSLPAAISERRMTKLAIDGSLEDWDPADAIQDGPMIRMFSRPALQRQTLAYASTPTNLYTSWAEKNLYIAFKVAGVASSEVKATRNFVDYQFRRAWGEDLCEMLIQPMYSDNSLGPILHLVCKPTGHWVERKIDPRLGIDPWEPLEAAGIRYAATLEGDNWRGEVAVPWKAINDPNRGMPTLLRFNFTQHQTKTGESASWAGPIDYGRDEGFMGLVQLRETPTPGIAIPTE
jgi:hypothetical protein